MCDRRIDCVLGDIAFHAKVVVAIRILRQGAALHFHLVPGLPRARDYFADSPHRLRVARNHAEDAEVVQDIFGRNSLGPDAAFGERDVFGHERIQTVTDHHLNPLVAEDILHDLGVFSMISSDSQAMGRIGEVVTRTWQTGHKMKVQRGALAQDSDRNDNFRVKRYVAKYTINPAITHGISGHVGSIAAGKLADLVLWKPAFFGVKPEIVIKGGFIAWSVMGDSNASIPTPQPVLYRPMFGAFGKAMHSTSLTFVSRAALEREIPKRLGLEKTAVAVSHCRDIGKTDMIHNVATPDIEVDPETYEVRANGELLTCKPAKVLPLAQRYFLF